MVERHLPTRSSGIDLDLPELGDQGRSPENLVYAARGTDRAVDTQRISQCGNFVGADVVDSSWEANGYDCSGAVSYLLHAAGLLSSPMASGRLRHWGFAGAGQWITVYANRSHAWMTVAGLRFDTSSAGESWNQGSGPRWRRTNRSAAGYAVRFAPSL